MAVAGRELPERWGDDETTFTIYESSPGIGGTWWDNTYPGAEVDVHSNLYSYSFKPYDWTRTHARQPELQSYLEETVDEFGLRPHLRLGVAVQSATWDDDRHIWSVTPDSGAVDDRHVLISAVGFVNVPRYPDWPGLGEFEGPKFHTSRWEGEPRAYLGITAPGFPNFFVYRALTKILGSVSEVTRCRDTGP